MSAMRQSDNFRGHWTLLYGPQLKEILKNAYIVEDVDRMNALKDQSNKNPVKLNQKKGYLKNLQCERGNILEDAKQFDDVFNTNMMNALDRVIPSQQKHIPKDNDGAARSLVSLREPLQVFMSKYDEQRKISNATMRSTRGATQEPLHIQYIQQILEVFKQVDARVVEENAGKLIKQFTPVTLSREQRERTFDLQRHLMLDEGTRDCLFCQHPSVNSVPENDSVVSDNQTTIAEHNAANKVYMDWKRKQEAENKKTNGRTLSLPKNPNTKKVMKQAPKLGALKEINLMCMCKNSHCLMKNYDTGSTCFTRCIDVGTDIRCPWDPITAECTCEICMCQCPAAYKQSDAAKIALSLMQLQQAGHLETLVNSSTPKDGEAGQLREFLVKTVNGGIAAAANATANNNKVSDEVTESLVMEHTASAIVRSAGSLPAPARQAMQKQFGNSTVVTLPNGDRINTRQLGASRVNLHTNNNRLGTSTSTVGQYLPGMQNHQQPDLSNPTQNFMTAAKQPSAANAFLGPLFATASAAATAASMPASSTAAAAPASTVAATQDNRQQVMSDELFARRLAREEEVQKYESMDNGGGKMGPTGTQQDYICLDGCTPSPPLTTNQPSVVSTLSSGAVSGRGRTGRDQSAAGSLLSPFGASSSADNSRGSSLSNTIRNAKQRDEARNNNAHETLQNLENHNNARMTSWKSKEERTSEEKQERKKAKRRNKQVIVPLQNMRVENPSSFTRIMSSVVAPGEQTLSQTPLKASPQKLINRLENALAEDSSSDEDGDS